VKKLFLALVCAVLSLSAAPLAQATDKTADGSNPVPIGSYDGWNAYQFHDKGELVCFMSRAPEKQEGKFRKRGPVFFFITHYSNGKDTNVVSVSGGYTFKPKSPVTLAIKNKKFSLYTQGEKEKRASDMAWTKDQSEDNAVVKEILAGGSMTVKGTSSRGTNTTDTYGLKGATEAYRAITQNCVAGKEAPAAGKAKK
jgi:hypothetical protein